MAIIDGINVAVWECTCGERAMWLFRGQGGEGYKITCASCGLRQDVLEKELKLPYLWAHLEAEAP